jgi:hypothetical protein
MQQQAHALLRETLMDGAGLLYGRCCFLDSGHHCSSLSAGTADTSPLHFAHSHTCTAATCSLTSLTVTTTASNTAILILLLIYCYCNTDSFPALAGDGSKRPHRQHSDGATGTTTASSAVRQAAPVQTGTVVSGRGVVLAPSDQNKLAAAMTEAALKHARSVNAKVKAMAQ